MSAVIEVSEESLVSEVIEVSEVSQRSVRVSGKRNERFLVNKGAD